MILEEKQLEKLTETYKTWLKTVETTLPAEMERRSQVSKKMHELLEEVGLFNAGTFNADQLCRSIKLQQEVQNLNALPLTKFLK